MRETNAPILTVENLSIAFGETEAVRGLGFEVPRGGTLAIVGESGSGMCSDTAGETARHCRW